MRPTATKDGLRPTDFEFRRVEISLPSGSAEAKWLACRDVEDFLGGIGRGFKYLLPIRVADPFDPASPIVVNTGVLTGSEIMTGLRVYFHGYSPLKRTHDNRPLAMWSAGSDKFGVKLRGTGADELVITGRCDRPSVLVVRHAVDGPAVEIVDGADLVGLTTSAKILRLADRYDDAHFAVIGPAGEHFANNYFAGIALSTQNMLRQREPKMRWCGRGGFGAVLGSKNILAIVAQGPDPTWKSGKAIAAVNQEIARGPGSRKFRDPDKADGAGGTWSNYVPLQDVHAVPQYNFRPRDDSPAYMFRDNVEQEWPVVDESCFKCGIACWKDLSEPSGEKTADGKPKPGRFLAKVDYEPLNMLGNNCGVNERAPTWKLIAECDELGFDSISCGVVLSYVMEYNERHPDSTLGGGLRYGDADGMVRLMHRIAAGQEPDIGKGTRLLSEKLGDTSFAHQCKGLELPAYLPETNPGYPWAIAGGHMSMRTFLLLLMEGKTDLDYWVAAIVEKGLYTVRDDMDGLCKFAGLGDPKVIEAIRETTGVAIDADELKQAVQRTYLRAYAIERAAGCDERDYVLPEQSYEPNPWVKLPSFVTRDFFAALRDRVNGRFDQLVRELKLVS
jgi:aldehyde:ferredoxin oxidoreductase